LQQSADYFIIASPSAIIYKRVLSSASLNMPMYLKGRREED